ncbi:MAG: cell division ATP-binding protein FtsE [Clostridiales bacterium]|jgi:cell division transport system ATP-binding protein|nr:cell division ATP-binding protein FtsE [Clostridiales bacterium]
MIRINNATKIYENGARGVQDVTLNIEKGEFAFIVGSSGCGKSTLIKLLLKEVDLTEGEIFINNENVTYFTNKDIPFLRRKMGVVFQDFRLLPNKTVYENVAFAMQITDATNREIRRNVPMCLSMVGLQKKSKAYPNQLSGGEQQRCALARAIVNNPPLLICDEPTGNLDPTTAWDIMNLLNEINDRGTTVVMATHAWDIVDGMKKRVIALKNGFVVRDVERGGYSDDEFYS